MVKYTKSKDLTDRIKDWPEPNFSKGALGVLEKRYLMKDDYGKVIETPKEALYRVAHVISGADKLYGDSNLEESERKFYELMADGRFFPNSPTIKGAGLDINLSACYYLPIDDSREGIFKEGFYNAVCVQAFGGGTGFNFSKLRPRGSLVSTTKGKASGPVSFMKIFDYGIGPVIAQGGTRNGANMGILNYDHPDIEEFITCKLNGGITNFNISVGVTEEFMEKVERDEEYELSHPKSAIRKKVKAKDIFNKIVHNAWINGDPGIIFLDRLERDNPTPHIGKIDGTNPCGEQPLLPLEACNLGSINLAKFIEYKNGAQYIDYLKLKETVHDAVHFLDNVIDANRYPLEKTKKEKTELRNLLEKKISDSKLVDALIEDWAQSPIEKMVKGNRKIGLGVMGFADMLLSINVPYGSEESYKIAEKVMGFIDEESKNASMKLAETRGVFQNWKGSIFDSESKNFKGKDMKLRNATTTTIAPTGTLSILSGGAGGIEPLFAIAYDRRTVYDQKGEPTLEFLVVDNKFKETAKKEKFYNEKLFQEIQKNHGSIQRMSAPEGVSEKRWKEMQNLFITAHDLSPKSHIQIQSIFQRHVDNAVSKTINMPREATEEDVREAYLESYRLGTKGITIYRDGSKANQVMSVNDKKSDVSSEENERPEVLGKTIKQNTPHGSAFITLNVREDELKRGEVVPYEIFTAVGKGGKDISAIAEGYGRLLSLLVKHTPLKDIVEQLRGIGGETQIGFGESRIYSLPDAIARGVEEAYTKLNNGNGIKKETKSFSGNLCPDCGSALIESGGCQKCASPICGFSRC